MKLEQQNAPVQMDTSTETTNKDPKDYELARIERTRMFVQTLMLEELMIQTEEMIEEFEEVSSIQNIFNLLC